jgi:DNA polymerase
VPASEARRAELVNLFETVSSCTACRLAETRTKVVFGAGNADADLMFVGEAPGFHEDQQGLPFVGAAGKLLERLLGEIGLTRDDVFIANTLKCRPPNNRDPLQDEVEACYRYLARQIELIKPRVIATLGNHATKRLTGNPTGITRVHGHEQEVVLGNDRVLMYPLYHPAAALYTQSLLGVLEEDFRRLPELLGREQAPASEPAAARVVARALAQPPAGEPELDAQLDLF